MKKVLLVVSLISVLLLAGCNKNENVENSNLSETQNTQQQEEINVVSNEDIAVTKYNYNITNRKEIQAVTEGYVEVLIDTEGNAYLYTLGNYENESTNVRSNLHKIEEMFSVYSPKNYVGYGPEEDTELKAYKLNVNDVLTAYYVRMGQAGFGYFVLVKENGALSYLSYDNLINDGVIELKDISNLKNILAIVQNDYTLTPYAIDIEGNEISLYDYIK